jgi:hypothetical protein
MWFFPWTNAVVEKFGPPSLSKIRDIMVDLRKQILTQLEWKELEKSINGIRAVLISET